MIDRVGKQRPMRSLDVELGVLPLASARQIGLSDAWTQRLAQHTPTRRQALTVVRLVGGSAAAGSLQQGGLLLAIGGKGVTRLRGVERAAAGKAPRKGTV